MDPDQKAKIKALIEKGWNSSAIAPEIGISVQTVAAVRAHTTMGTYAKIRSEGEIVRFVEGKPDRAGPMSRNAGLEPNV
jgi:FixJ family two-component response regulator